MARAPLVTASDSGRGPKMGSTPVLQSRKNALAVSTINVFDSEKAVTGYYETTAQTKANFARVLVLILLMKFSSPLNSSLMAPISADHSVDPSPSHMGDLFRFADTCVPSEQLTATLRMVGVNLSR
jgi:hypothetical protein